MGQKWIHGEVTDAETGATLPAVTLQVEGTNRGTITNALGRFELFIDPIPATLLIRHIGYRTESVSITAETSLEIAVSLTPVRYELEGVVVSGEDPAVDIMRKVLAAKQAWRKSLLSTYAEVYTRFKLYREQDLVQVQETVGAAYWRPNNGPKEVVRARRTRPRNSGVFRFAAPVAVPNLYDDDIEVLGQRLIGPTHPDALDVYTFTLTGHRKQDDRVVYDISFATRKPLQPTFVGHLAVLDSVYAVLSIGMRPHPGLVFSPPVIDANVYYEQQYAPFGEGYWLPVDFHAAGAVRFGRVGVHYPRARFEQVSRLTLHAVNVPTPDTLFRQARTRFIDPLVDLQDYLFRWNPGLVPLTPREIEEVVGLDSRMTLQRAFRPTGYLRGYLALDLVAPEEGREETASQGLIPATLANAWTWYNRVDGWHVGVRPRVSPIPGWQLSPGLAYDVARKRLAYVLGVQGTLVRTSRLRGFLAAEGGDVSATRYGALPFTRTTAGVGRYAGFDDYFDYYRRRYLAVRTGLHVDALDATFSAGFAAERHRSLTRNTGWRGWVFKSGQRENPPVDDGTLRVLTLRLDVGSKPGTLWRPASSRLTVELAHSPGAGLGSDFDFSTLRGQFSFAIPTFLARRRWRNTLALRFVGGAARGTVPVQWFGAVDARVGLLGGFGGMRAGRSRPYEGERYAALFWEHDFSTLFFEALGLWGLAERGIGLALYGAHGRTWIDGRRRASLSFTPVYTRHFHHEVGLSLTHLFRLPVRLDLTTRLDRKGVFFTVGLFNPR